MVTYQVEVSVGDGADMRILNPCNVRLPMRITHGRSAAGSQPDAPALTFAWTTGHVPAGRRQPAIEAPATIGEVITVVGQGSRRFRGRITDVQAVETGGLVVEWLVAAIGDQARLGRIQVVQSRPVETDIQRAAAILQSAGLPHRVEGSPRVTLAADNIDRSALSALHEVCASSGGLLWQDRAGLIVYTGNQSAGPAAIVPCAGIGDGVDWTQSVTDIVNRVTVTWREGPAETPVEHQWTMSDGASIAAHGVWHRDASSLCSTQTDAGALGAHILARWAAPRWTVPDVIVYPGQMDGPTVRDLMALDVGSVVLLPISPSPQPTPAELSAWTVEGWAEEWSTRPPRGHRMQLAVTDARLENALRTWDEVALETWNHWAQGTWMQMLIKEEVP